MKCLIVLLLLPCALYASDKAAWKETKAELHASLTRLKDIDRSKDEDKKFRALLRQYRDITIVIKIGRDIPSEIEDAKSKRTPVNNQIKALTNQLSSSKKCNPTQKKAWEIGRAHV